MIMDFSAILETLTGLFGVFGEVAGMQSAFYAAFQTMHGAITVILEFIASFIA